MPPIRNIPDIQQTVNINKTRNSIIFFIITIKAKLITIIKNITLLPTTLSAWGRMRIQKAKNMLFHY